MALSSWIRAASERVSRMMEVLRDRREYMRGYKLMIRNTEEKNMEKKKK